MFAARDKGLPIVCIGVAHQITPFIFVARKDGPVKTIQDFKGKTVTTWFTGANHVLTGMLTKEGVKPDEVNIQPQQVSVTPFVDGNVDVITATYYNEFYTIQSRMPKDNLKTFVAEDYGITFPRDTLIVAETTAKENPISSRSSCVRRSRAGRTPSPIRRAPSIPSWRWHRRSIARSRSSCSTEMKRLMFGRQGGEERPVLDRSRRSIKTAHDFFLKYGVISKPRRSRRRL